MMRTKRKLPQPRLVYALALLCLLMAGGMAMTRTVARAAFVATERLGVTLKDMDLHDMTGKVVKYEEECLGTKTVVIVGRPACSNTRSALSKFNTYYDAVQLEKFKMLFVDVEKSQKMREKMKALPGYRNIQFYGTKNDYYQTYVGDKMQELGQGTGGFTFPLVLQVNEEGVVCRLSEGPCNEKQSLKDFCGEENFDESKQKGDVPLTENEASAKVLELNKREFDANPTEPEALDFFRYPFGLSATIKEKVSEIVAGVEDDAGKVAAIYDWIVKNIKHDYDADEDATPAQMLNSKTGTGTAYANLFNSMLKGADIPCRIVWGAGKAGFTGWTQVLDSMRLFAWSEAYYDGSWHIFDPMLECVYLDTNENGGRSYYDCSLEEFSANHWIWDGHQEFVCRPKICEVDAQLDGNHLKWELKEQSTDSLFIRRREEGSQEYKIIGWIEDGKQYHVTMEWYDGQVRGNYERDVSGNDFVDYYFVPGTTYYYECYEYNDYVSDEWLVGSKEWGITDLRVEEKSSGILSCTWGGGSRLYEYKLYEKAPNGVIESMDVRRNSQGEVSTLWSSRRGDGTYEYWLTAWDPNTKKQVHESNHISVQRETKTAVPVRQTPLPGTQKTDTGAGKVSSSSTISALPAGSKPGVAKILSVKNKKRGQVSVRMGKVRGASGYVIEYGTNKSFKKAKRQYSTKTTAKVGGLKKKKTYYVRIRAYRLGKTGKVYGAWSKVKKVLL